MTLLKKIKQRIKNRKQMKINTRLLQQLLHCMVPPGTSRNRFKNIELSFSSLTCFMRLKTQAESHAINRALYRLMEGIIRDHGMGFSMSTSIDKAPDA